MDSKIVLITGATAGIGEACAEKFAENRYQLIITGRREEKLKKLARRLEQEYKAIALPLVFDVRNQKQVENAIRELPDNWKKIDVLVNNAGLAAGLNTVQEGQISDWEQMIDTNIKGLLYVSRAVSPAMIERKSGHIINIGSIAGKEVYPRGNVYCSTKHAVDALTKGMRLDMMKHGVRVSQVAPGAVETEFSMVRFKGDRERAEKVYDGYRPLQASDVAEAVFWVATLPDHVNVNDLLIMPTDQANATTFHKL
ncbi:MAG: SDR family oxidoreductase [Bacteroidales bacterium]|nr:SDR family oxidoreductase [Bacteroidales bacterium]MCF8351789.1 SDR family oxidoreductase [Bacteroidales bacterium]MCF8377357.1 SDR family oxidoreductase [Bacteroidales bacterium]MCF8401382.1 SDR family oxidoreductase [Bacteroidales bacterium]